MMIGLVCCKGVQVVLSFLVHFLRKTRYWNSSLPWHHAAITATFSSKSKDGIPRLRSPLLPHGEGPVEISNRHAFADGWWAEGDGAERVL